MQHKVSGLRARFHPAADKLGTVYAKSYKIDSIDAAAPGKSQDWNDYVGLGIGRRIYMAGAELLPDQRWALGEVTTEAAQALRRRLHGVEPYRWQADACSWCSLRGLDWRFASVASREVVCEFGVDVRGVVT